jgi:hypothetical protein
VNGGYIALGVILAIIFLAIIAFIIYRLVTKKDDAGSNFGELPEEPTSPRNTVPEDLPVEVEESS